MKITAGKDVAVEAAADATVKASASATFQGNSATLKGATTSVVGQTSFSMG